MFAALFLPVVIIGVIGVFRLGRFLLEPPESHAPLSESAAALQKNLRIAGVIILVAGLLAAGVIYQNAPAADDESGAIGYEIDGGAASPLQAGDSKSYDREMEGMGGSISVLGAEIRGWFQGRKLAYTVAILSLGGALVCFIFAQLQAYAPPEENS